MPAPPSPLSPPPPPAPPAPSHNPHALNPLAPMAHSPMIPAGSHHPHLMSVLAFFRCSYQIALKGPGACPPAPPSPLSPPPPCTLPMSIAWPPCPRTSGIHGSWLHDPTWLPPPIPMHPSHVHRMTPMPSTPWHPWLMATTHTSCVSHATVAPIR